MPELVPQWLPDPQDPDVERYWDGKRWTGESRLAHGEPELAPSSLAARQRPSWRRLAAPVILVALIATAFILSALGTSDSGEVAGATSVDSAAPAASPDYLTCRDSFEAAAAVPAAEEADAPLLSAAETCATVAEWSAAFRANPEAFGLYEFPPLDDVPYYIASVCVDMTTPLCVHATEIGVFEDLASRPRG